MMSAIQIRKAGFAFRVPNEEFTKRYRPIIRGNVQTLLQSPKEASQNIREQFIQRFPKQKDDFQLGYTKVFLREKARASMDILLEEARAQQRIKIQRAMKRAILWRRFREAVKHLQCANRVIKILQRQQFILNINRMYNRRVACDIIERCKERQVLRGYFQRYWKVTEEWIAEKKEQERKRLEEERLRLERERAQREEEERRQRAERES